MANTSLTSLPLSTKAAGRNKRYGYSNWRVPPDLCFLKEHGNTMVMPRGFVRQLLGILKRAGVPLQVSDRRRILPQVDFNFKGNLRDFQGKAVEAMNRGPLGRFQAPTGSGKTVMALALVALRRQPTLIVVHTKELLEQWGERIESFIGIPGCEVGRIGDGRLQVGEKITVALVQSLYRCAQKVVPRIGHLIVDECHRAPARTFIKAVTAFDSLYMLGLSATPFRRDGLSRLIYWYLGDKVHEIPKSALIAEGHILEVEVAWRETAFRPTSDPTEEYSRMMTELSEDEDRNALIAQDVSREAQNGSGICLVLTDRKAHCGALMSILKSQGLRATLLTGDLSNRERQQVVKSLNSGRVKVLVATDTLIGEGFDCPQLSTLFLATPIRFSGRLTQYLGRILRPAPGKQKAKVYDYLDQYVGVLVNAAKGRGYVYGEANLPPGEG